MNTRKQQPIKPIEVYGVLAKVTLADSNNKPATKAEAVEKPNAKRRRRSESQPTK